MKTLATLLLSVCLTATYAQSGTPAKTTPTSTVTPTAPVLSDKAKSLCKEWKLISVESFDLVTAPTELQKGDIFNLMENGRYRLIYDGVAEGGTWTIDKANVWITMTSDAGVVKKYQIQAQSDTELKIFFRDADGAHNILIYGPSTKAK